MIYRNGIWVKEDICDLTADKQAEIRTEVTKAYRFFGYDGEQLERMVAKALDSDLGDVCNLLGAYHWAMNDSEISARIICGQTADSAIQSQFAD